MKSSSFNGADAPAVSDGSSFEEHPTSKNTLAIAPNTRHRTYILPDYRIPPRQKQELQRDPAIVTISIRWRSVLGKTRRFHARRRQNKTRISRLDA
jgi:hypothetical protein